MPSIDTDTGWPVPREFRVLPTFDNVHFGVLLTSPTECGQVWIVDDGHVRISGDPATVLRAREAFALPGSAPTVQQIAECIQKNCLFANNAGTAVQPLNVPPGKFFPRICRPSRDDPNGFPKPWQDNDNLHERAAAIIQFSSLVDRLGEAFRYIEPDERNYTSFGTEFRNIIILAATEFEAQCKAIMRANSHRIGSESRFNTKDYVLLDDAMGLSFYKIRFLQFPWIPDRNPFVGWNKQEATKSLLWYSSYNDLKHDREKNFTLATLLTAIDAVSALLVVNLAQFGIDFLRDSRSAREMFVVSQYPGWAIGDTYGHSVSSELISGAVAYQFGK